MLCLFNALWRSTLSRFVRERVSLLTRAPAALVGPSVPSLPSATIHALERPESSNAAAAANSGRAASGCPVGVSLRRRTASAPVARIRPRSDFWGPSSRYSSVRSQCDQRSMRTRLVTACSGRQRSGSRDKSAAASRRAIVSRSMSRNRSANRSGGRPD